ncbi:MAG: hypothetical protein KF862_19030 [Chitinophagaceae bacterium]|nr:hypothetical protein [Chitinophagaceae bacterium]
MKIRIFISVCLFVAFAPVQAQEADRKPSLAESHLLGMYVHQHWSYNHPYAARTWTLEDWRGYIDGLKKLGFNAVLIWPMLETMPDPLTASDEENLAKIAKVIDMIHEEFGMRAYITLCPNVSAKNEVASKYTFTKRPFFYTDDRVDPGDAVAFGKLIEWREKLLKPLAKTDGVFIIDSDPGGYPYSTNYEFAYLLGAHRRMLNRIRPGIEVIYWAHFGWEAYSMFYATGDLIVGTAKEPVEVMQLLSRNSINEPWGVISSGFGAYFADSVGMSNRVITFPYGAIEGEPSFPLTNYDERAVQGARKQGKRGIFGNAQTHAVQLPATFAFARSAQGLPVEKSDYINFANELIKGGGMGIVEGWEALKSENSGKMKLAVKKLEALKKKPLATGIYSGLLFGSPERFITDLIMQLQMVASMTDFINAVNNGASQTAIKKALTAFVATSETWQQTHGYSNHWNWDGMLNALKKLNHPQLTETIATLAWLGEGNTQFEKVKNGMARLETFTPRLIQAMKKASLDMDKK